MPPFLADAFLRDERLLGAMVRSTNPTRLRTTTANYTGRCHNEGSITLQIYYDTNTNKTIWSYTIDLNEKKNIRNNFTYTLAHTHIGKCTDMQKICPHTHVGGGGASYG